MTQLRRALSTFDLTMIAIGGTIGSGIFLTPSLIAQQLPSPAWMLTIWLLGGLLTLCGALAFAELGGMFPGAGGMYRYLSESFGPLFGFLFGWAYLLVVNTGGIAALSLAFASYLGYFIPLSDTGIQLVGAAGLSIVTILNIVGVRVGGIFSDIFTILKLLGIAVLIVAGIGWGSQSLYDTETTGQLPETGMGGAIGVALIGVLWSFGGWQHASFTAGEAKDPTKGVPRAMVIGSLVVTAVYVLANLAYLFAMSPEEIAASPRVAAEAMDHVIGPAGGGLIAMVIFISTFGSTGVYTLTVPRVYYAMAKDGLFFARVAALHPRFHTPVVAILLQSGWALVLIFFWGTFNELISYVVFTDWIFFGLTAAGVLVLRRKRPDLPRTYKALGYPLTPFVFVAVSAWFVLNTMLVKPLQAWVGIAFLALGVPVYLFWSRQKPETR
jgi:APA family basic amino acid/polyamine antiporter